MDKKFNIGSQLPILSTDKTFFGDLFIDDKFFYCSIIWRKVSSSLREAIDFTGVPTDWKRNLIGKVIETDYDALCFKVL